MIKSTLKFILLMSCLQILTGCMFAGPKNLEVFFGKAQMYGFEHEDEVIAPKKNVGVYVNVTGLNDALLWNSTPSDSVLMKMRENSRVRIRFGKDVLKHDIISFVRSSIHNEALYTGEFIVDPDSLDVKNLVETINLNVVVNKLTCSAVVSHGRKDVWINENTYITVDTYRLFDNLIDIDLNFELIHNEKVIFEQHIQQNFKKEKLRSVRRNRIAAMRELSKALSSRINFISNDIVFKTNLQISKLSNLKEYKYYAHDDIHAELIQPEIVHGLPANFYKPGYLQFHIDGESLLWGELIGRDETKYYIEDEEFLITVVKDKLLSIKDKSGKDVTKETLAESVIIPTNMLRENGSTYLRTPIKRRFDVK